MAAITTAQSGNWSATTTWTGGVVPGDGDTVTVNHAVTVDQNTTVGTSPVASTAVVTVNTTAGASLTVNSGITFRVKGDLYVKSNPFTMQAGSTLIFDSTGSASPTTTTYRILSNSNAATAFTFNGTSGSRCTVTADMTGGALGFHITMEGITSGDFVATYTDFSNMNQSASGRSVNIGPVANKSFSLDHCTITNHTATIYIGGNTPADGHIDINYLYLSASNETEATTSFTVLGAVPTTGKRNLKNSYIGGLITNTSTTSFAGWTLDGSVFQRINFVNVTAPHGDMASAKNVTFSANLYTNASFMIYNNNANFEDFFMLHNTFGNNSSHLLSAIMYNRDLTLNKGVVESTNGSPSDNCLQAPFAQTTDPVDRTYTTTENNVIFGYNAAGYSSGRPFQFKSTYNRQFIFDNNTLPLMYSQSPAAGAISHGTNSTNHPGMVQSIKNNLCFKPDSYTSVTDRTWLVKVAQQAVISGTAGGTSTTTSLVAGSSLFQTGATAPVGHTVKITSGPDAGLKRAVTAGVSATTLTVAAFPNTMAGQTFEVYGVDSVVDGGADYNAFYGARAEGTIYDSDNVSSRTSVTGYGDFRVTTPANIGAHDLILSAAPRFRDDTRTIARFSIDYLNNAVGTAWETATAYAVGDIRSRAVTGTWGGRTVNYRCIKAHTSGAAYDAPGEFTGTSTDHWRLYWELESMYEIRKAQTQLPGYNPLAVQSNYLTWMRDGFTPRDMVLATAGAGGTYIGAVMPADDYKAAALLMGF